MLAYLTLLAVPASAPWKTLQDFVDDAKKRPGEIPYGSSGPYGTLHIAMEMFAASAGTPDVVCLAKAICGGLPGGAVGMTDELAALVASGQVRQQGTFNGNPLVMAAAEATLLEVLTDEGYAKLNRLNEDLMAGCDRIISEYGLPAHTVGMGSKGCVVFSSEPIREYRDYLTKIHHDLTEPRVAVPHEQRHLHDAGRGRGVDAVRAAHETRTSSATSRCSRPSRVTSRPPADPPAGTWLIACSASAVMVRLGFTPTLAGIAAPSQTSRFS